MDDGRRSEVDSKGTSTALESKAVLCPITHWMIWWPSTIGSVLCVHVFSLKKKQTLKACILMHGVWSLWRSLEVFMASLGSRSPHNKQSGIEHMNHRLRWTRDLSRMLSIFFSSFLFLAVVEFSVIWLFGFFLFQSISQERHFYYSFSLGLACWFLYMKKKNAIETRKEEQTEVVNFQNKTSGRPR